MKSARITGQESLDVNGTPVLVTVIEGERAYNYAGKEDCHQSKAKFWIDMERKVALKSSDEWSCGAQFVRHTEITRKVVINPELSDSLFKFKPPEGAIEVREFSRGVKPKTVGQGTPDFQLKDAAGAYLGPAAWRGKIVVLWFASDDMHDELQFLELLHRALGSRDLVAIAVAHELNAPWLRDFSDEGYTVPVATDPGMAASKALGMDSTPGWAVLDRDGTILAVGSASCRQIAMVLKKAGVW